MPDETQVNESEHLEVNPSSSQSPHLDFKNEREIWRDFFRSDAKHEAEINLINRQLSEIKTDIKNLDNNLNIKVDNLDKSLNTKIIDLDKSLNTKIIALDERLNTKMDKILAEFDKAVAIHDKEKSLIKGLALGTILALVAVLFTLYLK
jgi:hypothetical protein